MQGSACFLLGGLLLETRVPMGSVLVQTWPCSLAYVAGCQCFLVGSMNVLQQYQTGS